jgi:hypothetical protein
MGCHTSQQPSSSRRSRRVGALQLRVLVLAAALCLAAIGLLLQPVAAAKESDHKRGRWRCERCWVNGARASVQPGGCSRQLPTSPCNLLLHVVGCAAAAVTRRPPPAPPAPGTQLFSKVSSSRGLEHFDMPPLQLGHQPRAASLAGGCVHTAHESLQLAQASAPIPHSPPTHLHPPAG